MLAKLTAFDELQILDVARASACTDLDPRILTEGTCVEVLAYLRRHEPHRMETIARFEGEVIRKQKRAL